MAAVLTIVPFGSALYRKTLVFRDAQLRRPLGLTQGSEDLAGEDQQIHLALVDNDIVQGTLVLRPESDRMVKLRQMAVSPDLRGQGAGRSLVAFAEQIARERGFRRIELHARVSARLFYERLGYQAYGAAFEEVTIPHIAMARNI